ncbi:MAG: sensor histidine kinase [Gaiellales bacterium]
MIEPTPRRDAPLTLEGVPRTQRLRIHAGQVLGLLFLTGPAADLARSWDGARSAAVALLLAAFIALYLALLPPVPALATRGPRAIASAVAGLIVIEGAILALGAPSSFATLSVYVAAAAGFALPARAAMAVIAGMAAALGVGMRLTDFSDSAIAAFVLTTLAIGAMMLALANALRTNRDLRVARQELAELAVAEERLRIARDLHDLLGHNLSVIALKGELAERLVDRDPEGAKRELADVQQVTRRALADVRGAVQGYRRMALPDAVGGARAVLAAAGVDVRFQGPDVDLPADVESVLAWAVREAATNIVRHSDARSCAITLLAADGRVALEVADDGSSPAAGRETGSGLTGLAERAAQLHGTLQAGPRAGGGFQLCVSLPLVTA